MTADVQQHAFIMSKPKDVSEQSDNVKHGTIIQEMLYHMETRCIRFTK